MATEDILINDGDEFISLSALAAEQVDCDLPISSSDDTVTLDGASSVLTVSIGGDERVTVTDAAAIFGGQVQTDKITSKDGASNEASIDMGAEVEVRTDGRFIVAPQTRGPTLTDAVITAGSWNLNKGAILEFGWPDVSASDYVARAAIRKNSVNSDLVYAHYNLSGTESVQNGHVFYSNILGQVGIGNKLMELREGGTAVYTGGEERVKVTDAATIFSNQVQTDTITSKDAAAGDASIELGANLIVSTGGEDVANVSPAGVGVFRLAAYPLDTSCKGALGVRLGSVGGVTNGATITNPNDGGGWRFQMDNQVSEDGSFGFDFRNRRLGLGTFADGPTEALHVVGNIKCDNGQVQTNTITSAAGAAGDASIQLGAELLTSNHTPTQPNSIATKQTVDDKIWVGTQEAYDLIDVKNIDTLYCITN